jgi:4-hydroxybenzoate polyprenyltransferase
MNTPPRNRLIVNKALRRRSGFFGFNAGLASMSLSILTLGLISAQFLPPSVAVSGTIALFIATIYIFRDGTDIVMGRFRKPRHYTRAGLDFISVFQHGKK